MIPNDLKFLPANDSPSGDLGSGEKEIELDRLIERGLSTASGAADREACHRLSNSVYHRFREIATRLMERQRPDHTLQPTALAHEAWIRLANAEILAALADSHLLFTVAELAMRHILTDHWRHRQRKGPGKWQRVPLNEGQAAAPQAPESSVDLEAMEQALCHLAASKPRACLVARLHKLFGLPLPQVAEVVGISLPTAERDWRVARCGSAHASSPRRRRPSHESRRTRPPRPRAVRANP